MGRVDSQEDLERSHNGSRQQDPYQSSGAEDDMYD